MKVRRRSPRGGRTAAQGLILSDGHGRERRAPGAERAQARGCQEEEEEAAEAAAAAAAATTATTGTEKGSGEKRPGRAAPGI